MPKMMHGISAHVNVIFVMTNDASSRITSKSEMTIKTMSRTMKEASGMRTTKRRPYRSLQAPANKAKTIVGTA